MIYQGAAIGLAINSVVVLTHGRAGLFINKDFLAEAALPVAVWLIWTRRWLLPFILPSLLIPQSRAVLLIGVPMLLWPFSRIGATVLAVMLILMLTVSLTLVWPLDRSKNERLAIWQDTLRGVTILGRGIGQFYGTFPEMAVHEDTSARRPLHAHDDFLEILYELGPIGFCLAAAFMLSLFGAGDGVWLYVFLAVVLDALVAFPFQNPASGILAMVAAGALYRNNLRDGSARFSRTDHVGARHFALGGGAGMAGRS
jgi:hypothetical protein